MYHVCFHSLYGQGVPGHHGHYGMDTDQQSTSLPTIGMTVIRLVITVSAQYDMSPQGRTYPMKAIPIISSQVTKDIEVR
jgi:hypothetical protein